MTATLVELAPSRRKIFALDSSEFLRRQLAQNPDSEGVLVAAPDIVLTDASLQWLLKAPQTAILSRDGRPLAGFASAATAESLASAMRAGRVPEGFTAHRTGQFEFYSRKLRRTERLGAEVLGDVPEAKVERQLFDLAYKGATDIITAKLWPLPAWHCVRILARLGVSPNMVTGLGLILTFAAGWFFLQGHWGAGLLAAWIMTFLDTVDGKLARVTAASSELGNKLDHLNDNIHPPIWWLCVAYGLAAGDWVLPVWLGFAVVLALYFVGRVSESRFKRTYGFSLWVWTKLDTRLRLVVARRNINLLFLTAGWIAGVMPAAWLAMTAWHVLSIGLQLYRISQAQRQAERGGAIENWMERAAAK